MSPPRPSARPLDLPPLGVGTNRWTDAADTDGPQRHTTLTSSSAGAGFFDTAETYGRGASERALGRMHAHPDVVLATKYMPLPWRRGPKAVSRALQASMQRMGRVDLYQLHFPRGDLNAWADGLARAVSRGDVRAIGVCNCDRGQLRGMHAALAHRDVPLLSHQVEYSLLVRTPERNGVLECASELGIRTIAHRPLAGGRLLHPPHFLDRSRLAHRRRDILHVLQRIAQARRVSPSAVALRWLMDRHVLPIPGTTQPAHAAANAQAIGWSLTPQETTTLDVASRAPPDA